MDNSKKGKALRQKVNRKKHAIARSGTNRPSIIDMIRESDEDRVPELIPVRHARMSVSPFTFYRGTAGIMARDLAQLPNTGIIVQAIGDCHLMNFGGFATPERTLIFDANDFDETTPAPWEWDVKRLATSFVLASRNNQLKRQDAYDIAHLMVQSYLQHISAFSKMDILDLWYMKFDLETMRKNAKNERMKQMISQGIIDAQKSTSQKVFYKITADTMGQRTITEQPPLIYHTLDIKKDHAMIESFMDEYEHTLQADRRFLLKQYKLVDAALKVVGVGSVGTRCYVALMMNEMQHPLFLQIKEARQSVLAPYTVAGNYNHNGQRVVEGQRLVQAASDIFLGWATGEEGRHFYIRQLRDRKIAPDVEHFDRELLTAYAGLCGRMLARAHAKTGNAAMISEYAGRKSNTLVTALTEFAVTYADQTEKDYAAYMQAIKDGVFTVQEVAEMKK